MCSGIALTLDIGVVDVSTCTPLPDAFVELWMGARALPLPRSMLAVG